MSVVWITSYTITLNDVLCISPTLLTTAYNITSGSDKHDGGINLVILMPACGGGALVIFVVVIVVIIIIRKRCHSRTKRLVWDNVIPLLTSWSTNRYYEQVLALINEEDLDDVIDDSYDIDNNDVIDDDGMIT